MKHSRLLFLTLVVPITFSVPLVMTGCGSSAKVEARTTTVGQELQDLEDARNKGLLTEDEYAKKRAQIMKKQ